MAEARGIVTPDVVVIGGGPAGLSAAIVLARKGIPTLLCEAKESTPLDKPCGEGLMPTCVDDLRRLGISEADLRAQGARFAGVRYYSPSGQVAEASFAEGTGIGLRRTALSALLVARARSLPSLKFISGAVARVRRGEGGSFSVLVGGEVFTPRLVVGADGLSSRIRRQAHIRERLRRPYRWGVRQHFAMAASTDHVEVHWGDGVEAYVTPVAVDRTNVAFLWEKNRVDVHAGAAGAFHHMLELFPVLSRKFARAKPCGAPRASGPMHRYVRRPARDGLLLIGDAAGYVDALTGEGVGLAVRQALLLEEHVCPILSKETAGAPAVTLDELKPYLRAARLACRPNHQLTKMLLRLRGHPALIERAIYAMAREPELFRHLLSANVGRVSPFRVPLVSTTRFLFRLFDSPASMGLART